VILIAVHRFKPHDGGMLSLMGGAHDVTTTSDVQRRTMRKIVTRLMPALLVLYVIAYLDRVNVTFAQDRLEQDLGFSGAVYGFGAGVFFIGYFLLEVPSNLALHKFGARKWMARIMITWGLISACTMFVTGPLSFYVVRFLLGVAEAGFFPGMILYLSYWYPARERARAVGVFMSAIAISYAIGAPISGGIMSVFDGVAGLKDWQWLFVIEAVPAIVAGILVFLKLPDGPQDAGWLEPDEKAWLAERLEGEEQQRLARERHSLGEVLKDRRVLVFALLYFTMVINVYGLSFWVGEIVDQINGLGNVSKGFVTAIPYAVAIVGMLVIPRYSDRTGERKRVIAVCLAAAAAAFVVSTVVSPVMAIPAIALGLFFLLGVHGVFWTMPAALLSGAAAAAGIALINSIGNLGGFAGPYLVGLVKDATNSTDGGLVALAAILLVGSVVALRCTHDKELEEAPRTRTGRFDRSETPAPQSVR
jgi:ACS family tartrate transporter-like MFS transporter